jgi:hypothetical protein
MSSVFSKNRLTRFASGYHAEEFVNEPTNYFLKIFLIIPLFILLGTFYLLVILKH